MLEAVSTLITHAGPTVMWNALRAFAIAEGVLLVAVSLAVLHTQARTGQVPWSMVGSSIAYIAFAFAVVALLLERFNQPPHWDSLPPAFVGFTAGLFAFWKRTHSKEMW